jgi:hypothetical protein
MSSCYRKPTPTVENYSEMPRSRFDQIFCKMYDPERPGGPEFPAPWPMQRTQYDTDLQQKWSFAPLSCNQPMVQPTMPPTVPTMPPMMPTMAPMMPTYPPTMMPTMAPTMMPTMVPSMPSSQALRRTY